VSDRLITLVFDEHQAQRLDKFLAAGLPEFSRSRLQDLIREGFVTVGGSVVYKTGKALESKTVIQVRIPPPEPSSLSPEAIPLDILFESDDLMVVNKPAGMVVHPSAGHLSGTLVNAALSHAPGMEGVGGEQRPGVVHRLDKDTSGLILLAKNDQAHRWLQNQFRERKAQKTYLALVDGGPPTPTGRIEAPIGRDPRMRKKMAVVASGKGREAVSEYLTVERFSAHTLLEVHPVTGRTHQIRLHLAFIGCPVAGDTIYGRRHATLALNRHFLHAARLTVRLRGEKEPRTFSAPLPHELEAILEQLK